MSNVVSLIEYRAIRDRSRAHNVCKESQKAAGVQLLFGEQVPGQNCPHCGTELAQAMALPSALKGYGCRQCQVWYSAGDTGCPIPPVER